MACRHKSERNNLEILVHVTASGPDKRWQEYAESILNFEPVTRQKLLIESYQPNQGLSLSSDQTILQGSNCLNTGSDFDLSSSPPDTTQSIEKSHAVSYPLSGPYFTHTTREICYKKTQDIEDSTKKKPLPDGQVCTYSEIDIEFGSVCPESQSHRLLVEEDLQRNCKKLILNKNSQDITKNLAIFTPDQHFCEREVTSKHAKDYCPDVDIEGSEIGRACSSKALNSGTLPRSINSRVNMNNQNHVNVTSGRMAESSGTGIYVKTYPKSLLESQSAGEKKKLGSVPTGLDYLPIASRNIFQDKTGQWTKMLEIRPTPPDIGNLMLTPENFITPSLRLLAEQGKLERNFYPENSTRDLRPLERGYWRVICPSWEFEFRIRFWTCLGIYIQKDNSAGWGVSCMRDEDFEEIRVYCWGIIVEHIYLLLWITSGGEICKTDACWIDAEGKTILKMGRGAQPKSHPISS